VELFPEGDIVFCYGNGTIEGNATENYFDDEYYINTFAAGVEDPDGGAYPMPFLPFDADSGLTSVWPSEKCWKFLMP
jgi:hypothetical protein